MKRIILSLVEFMNFRDIATFNYDFAISHGEVIVDAQANMLEQLGY